MRSRLTTAECVLTMRAYRVLAEIFSLNRRCVHNRKCSSNVKKRNRCASQHCREKNCRVGASLPGHLNRRVYCRASPRYRHRRLDSECGSNHQ